MDLIINLLQNNIYEMVAMILFGIGFMNLLLQNNLIKKIIGLNIMDTAIYLFLASKGFIEGGAVPIYNENIEEFSQYINPVPSGLILAGIVISVSITAFALALVQILYRHYGTIEMDEIMKLAKEKEGNKNGH